MKQYTVTVNGNVYQVTVEEGMADVATPVRDASATAVSTASTPTPTAKEIPKETSAADGVPITASVPGKIVRLEKKIGDAVSSGDTVLILEAMKMEIPVVAPQSGTVTSYAVRAGDAVESGDVLATLS